MKIYKLKNTDFILAYEGVDGGIRVTDEGNALIPYLKNTSKIIVQNKEITLKDLNLKIYEIKKGSSSFTAKRYS